MNKPAIINLENCISSDELAILKDYSFTVIDCSFDNIATASPLEPKCKEHLGSGLLRASRLTEDQYRFVYSALLGQNIRLRNTPEISNLLSEFALHYPLIADVSPRALVFAHGVSAAEIVEKVKSAGFGERLFIKTEKKSLKTDSMIPEITVERVDRCLQALTKAFAPFHNYVVKEVVPLEPTDHRAIVFGTYIAGFDTGPYVNDNDWVKTRVFDFVYDSVAMLARKGLLGDYVIDVAKRADTGKCVVVEIKDLQFTQVKNPGFIWDQIARHCPLE